jgi:hypothetical protein
MHNTRTQHKHDTIHNSTGTLEDGSARVGQKHTHELAHAQGARLRRGGARRTGTARADATTHADGPSAATTARESHAAAAPFASQHCQPGRRQLLRVFFNNDVGVVVSALPAAPILHTPRLTQTTTPQPKVHRRHLASEESAAASRAAQIKQEIAKVKKKQPKLLKIIEALRAEVDAAEAAIGAEPAPHTLETLFKLQNAYEDAQALLDRLSIERFFPVRRSATQL